MKKTYCITLNAVIEADHQQARTEYYIRFTGWKHGVISEENEIKFEGLNIEVPYARWSDNELIELGRVLRDAAGELIKADQ